MGRTVLALCGKTSGHTIRPRQHVRGERAMDGFPCPNSPSEPSGNFLPALSWLKGSPFAARWTNRVSDGPTTSSVRTTHLLQPAPRCRPTGARFAPEWELHVNRFQVSQPMPCNHLGPTSDMSPHRTCQSCRSSLSSVSRSSRPMRVTREQSPASSENPVQLPGCRPLFELLTAIGIAMAAATIRPINSGSAKRSLIGRCPLSTTPLGTTSS
jgi:hypothetical protein